MNTEREALELARKVLIEVVEADEQAIAELNHIGQTVAEPAVTAKCRHAIASILCAIANKPETSEPVGYINLDKLKKYGMAYAYSFDVVSKSTTQHSAIYTAPPSTAALQKRIEELEAVLAKKDEALEQAAKVAEQMPLNSNDEAHAYRFSDDCKAISWDIAHAIRALKAGYVQAPKEGWISVEDSLPERGVMVLASYYDGKRATSTYDGEYWWSIFSAFDKPTHWMPLPAAPTDTEAV